MRMSSKVPQKNLFNHSLPLLEPFFNGNEWKYVKECLDTGWVSSRGQFVEQFEKKVAQYTGAKYAVATVNGTTALHIAMLVLGIKPDEEVLVSNLAFVAPANAIRYCQAVPVLIDADPETWQMDVGKVKHFLEHECERQGKQVRNKRSGRNIRAILPVHVLGLACAMDRIVLLAREYGLHVIEDAAEGMGIKIDGVHVGTIGDIGVLSFNGNKIVTAGGGGMVLTNDSAKAEYAKYLSTQAKDDSIESIHNEIGYNYRLNNLQAAVGLAQLEQIDAFLEKKRKIAKYYEEKLRKITRISLMPSVKNIDSNFWLYTVLLRESTSLTERKEIVRMLNHRGIGSRPIWCPISDLPPYQDCQAYSIKNSPSLYRRGISLPSSVGLDESELAFCVKVAQEVLLS